MACRQPAGRAGRTWVGSPILKEKAAQFNQDTEIQDLLAEINLDDGTFAPFTGIYTREKAEGLKAYAFDRDAVSKRGLKYKKLDQLTIDLLLGAR